MALTITNSGGTTFTGNVNLVGALTLTATTGNDHVQRSADATNAEHGGVGVQRGVERRGDHLGGSDDIQQHRYADHRGGGFAFTQAEPRTHRGRRASVADNFSRQPAANFGVTAVTLTGNVTFNAGAGLVTLGATAAANFQSHSGGKRGGNDRLGETWARGRSTLRG